MYIYIYRSFLVGGLEHFFFFHILGMSSSQLTNSYFQLVFFNHQPRIIQIHSACRFVWGQQADLQLPHRYCPTTACWGDQPHWVVLASQEGCGLETDSNPSCHLLLIPSKLSFQLFKIKRSIRFLISLDTPLGICFDSTSSNTIKHMVHDCRSPRRGVGLLDMSGRPANPDSDFFTEKMWDFAPWLKGKTKNGTPKSSWFCMGILYWNRWAYMYIDV